jgi:hypothetical protein
MSSSGIGIARAPEDPSRIQTQQPAVPETPVAPQVREAAHWFFWVVAVTVMDSLLVLLGGQIHRFTGLGATAVVDSFTGANPVGHLITNGWLATFLMFLGFSALEGRKSAFAIGLGVYACDAALLVVAHDYFCIPFHAFVLYQLYRGFAALQHSSSSDEGAA